MKKNFIFPFNLIQLIVAVTLSIFLNLNAFTQNANQQKTRILFVLDGSQSMFAKWENGQKMQIATRLLGEMVDSLKSVKNVELALRAFGHQYRVLPGERSCKDTKLEVPFSSGNHNQIISKLRDITPKGTTLIAYSLEQAANDFPTCGDCKKYNCTHH